MLDQRAIFSSHSESPSLEPAMAQVISRTDAVFPQLPTQTIIACAKYIRSLGERALDGETFTTQEMQLALNLDTANPGILLGLIIATAERLAPNATEEIDMQQTDEIQDRTSVRWTSILPKDMQITNTTYSYPKEG